MYGNYQELSTAKPHLISPQTARSITALMPKFKSNDLVTFSDDSELEVSANYHELLNSSKKKKEKVVKKKILYTNTVLPRPSLKVSAGKGPKKEPESRKRHWDQSDSSGSESVSQSATEITSAPTQAQKASASAQAQKDKRKVLSKPKKEKSWDQSSDSESSDDQENNDSVSLNDNQTQTSIHQSEISNTTQTSIHQSDISNTSSNRAQLQRINVGDIPFGLVREISRRKELYNERLKNRALKMQQNSSGRNTPTNTRNTAPSNTNARNIATTAPRNTNARNIATTRRQAPAPSASVERQSNTINATDTSTDISLTEYESSSSNHERLPSGKDTDSSDSEMETVGAISLLSRLVSQARAASLGNGAPAKPTTAAASAQSVAGPSSATAQPSASPTSRTPRTNTTQSPAQTATRASTNETANNRPDRGAFTAIEREKVQEAITRFLTNNDVPREDIFYVLHPNMKLVTGADNPYTKRFSTPQTPLAEQIREMSGINRTKKQIYDHLNIMYREGKDPSMLLFLISNIGSLDFQRKAVRWTQEEDDELLRLVQLKGIGKWRDIERVFYFHQQCLQELGNGEIRL